MRSPLHAHRSLARKFGSGMTCKHRALGTISQVRPRVRGASLRSLLYALLAAALPLAAQSPAVVAKVENLAFEVAPQSGSGTAIEQTRRVWKNLKGNPLSVRAFVAGTKEEAQAVQQELGALARKRGKSAPALSVIQVGGLPQPGSKVVLESVRSVTPAVNRHGLAFVSGQPVSQEGVASEMRPLVEKSLSALQTAHRAAGLEPADILRITCFMSALGDIEAVRSATEEEFPKAAATYVQLVRTPQRSLVECETVARLRSSPTERLKMLSPDGLPKSPNYSQVALLSPGKVAFTSLRSAASLNDADARAVFAEAQKTLAGAGADIKNVAMSSLYPTSNAASELIRKIRFDYYDSGNPPGSTMLVFEGLPGAAAFGVAVVAPIGP